MGAAAHEEHFTAGQAALGSGLQAHVVLAARGHKGGRHKKRRGCCITSSRAVVATDEIGVIFFCAAMREHKPATLAETEKTSRQSQEIRSYAILAAEVRSRRDRCTSAEIEAITKRSVLVMHQ
jgi:hypothetical protein